MEKHGLFRGGVVHLFPGPGPDLKTSGFLIFLIFYLLTFTRSRSGDLRFFIFFIFSIFFIFYFFLNSIN